MEWLMRIIWDYFKCPKCDIYKQREIEIKILVDDLLKTQKEILKYIK